jgi:hypothetical protein
MNENCTLWTLRVERLKAFSLLRFFFALEKEMTRRHAQWLIVIKKTSNSSRPPTPKAPTPKAPTPKAPTPTTNTQPSQLNIDQ